MIWFLNLAFRLWQLCPLQWSIPLGRLSAEYFVSNGSFISILFHFLFLSTRLFVKFYFHTLNWLSYLIKLFVFSCNLLSSFTSSLTSFNTFIIVLLISVSRVSSTALPWRIAVEFVTFGGEIWSSNPCFLCWHLPSWDDLALDHWLNYFSLLFPYSFPYFFQWNCWQC